tara:strand:- start:1800 stop:2138 length:339 start_codon:yes stop_codon:yes gene_type:complete
MAVTHSTSNAGTISAGARFVVNVTDQDKDFIKKFDKANQLLISIREARDVRIELDGDPTRRWDISGRGAFSISPEDEEQFYSVVVTSLEASDTISANVIRVTWSKISLQQVG